MRARGWQVVGYGLDEIVLLHILKGVLDRHSLSLSISSPRP
jgi:hypothetical protein